MELQTQVTNQLPVVNNLQITATIPTEMVQAQQQLISWCQNKIQAVKAESEEFKEAYEIAEDKKWNTRTLKNQYYKSKRSISYYEKILAALEAGYYIVPNFPVQMFAIRTKKKEPNQQHEYHYWGDKDQSAQILPQGEGEYKNPAPVIERISERRDGDKLIQNAESYATGWDEFDFPITMAKPFIMQATSQAMALKIFDEFGILPATRNDDPVIIGHIIKRNGYLTKTVSFMIAWHLNTNVL